MHILHDTGAALSLLLERVLAASEESKTGKSVLVHGFEMDSTVVPLHRIELKSNVVTGCVAGGNTIGNDIGWGNVWKNDAEVLLHVAVPDKPLVHQCVQQHSNVIPACAVIRAMATCSSSS